MVVAISTLRAGRPTFISGRKSPSQAVRRGRLDDPQPLDARADPGPTLRVDDALVEAGRADQQLADQRGDGAVEGRLRGDDQAVTAGEAHCLHHVLRCPADASGEITRTPRQELRTVSLVS